MTVAIGCFKRAPLQPLENGPVSSQERIAAMLSVHAHARWPDRNFDGVDFLPLDTAMEILNRDKGPAADSRRRRAVAKLAAYAFQYRYVQTVIRALLIGHEYLFARLEHEIELRKSEPPAQLEPQLADTLTDLTLDCGWTKVKVGDVTGGVQPPPTTGWSFDVFIPRGVDEIALTLDPQNWDRCSLLFKDTHLVQTSGACCPNNPTNPGSPCTVTGTTSEPSGKPYGYTPFYEHFCIADDCSVPCSGTNSCKTNFENVLCVRTKYNSWIPFSCWVGWLANSYDVDYEVAATISGTMLGVPNQVAVTDQGGLSVRRPNPAEQSQLPTGVWSAVHVDKALAFGSSGTTGAVGKFLTTVVDELKWEILEQSCCSLKPEFWFACQ